DPPGSRDKLRDTRKRLRRLLRAVGRSELSRLLCDRTPANRWVQNDHSRENAVFRSASSVLRGRRTPSHYQHCAGRQSKPLVAVWRLNKPEHLQTSSTLETGSKRRARAAELPAPISSVEHPGRLETNRGTPECPAARMPRR